MLHYVAACDYSRCKFAECFFCVLPFSVFNNIGYKFTVSSYGLKLTGALQKCTLSNLTKPDQVHYARLCCRLRLFAMQIRRMFFCVSRFSVAFFRKIVFYNIGYKSTFANYEVKLTGAYALNLT